MSRPAIIVARAARLRKRMPGGFSLMEVVMALALVALAVPAIIGLFSLLSKTSTSTLDRGETASLVNAFQLYLDGKAQDAATGREVPFATVYQWVREAREDPENPMVLYAYKQIDGGFEYSISETQPGLDAIPVGGKTIAVKVLAPEPALLPDAALGEQVQDYARAYLPAQLRFHALSIPAEELSRSNFVDSYPVVISR